MTTSLLDGLNHLVTPDLLSTGARYLDASEGSVATALGAAFPSILAALAGKAGSPETMQPIFALIADPENDGSVVRNPALAVGAAGGDSPFLSSLFGPRLSSVGELVGRSASLHMGAGPPVLRIAASLVLGYLGKRINSGGLNPASFSDLLLGERGRVMREAPMGLSSVLCLTGSAAAPRVSKPEVSRPRGLWPELAALALIAGVVMWPANDTPPPVSEQTIGLVSRSATLAAGPDAYESDLPPDIVGTTWEWIGFTALVEQFQIDAPERYTIRFGYDGRIALNADCTRGIAGYSIGADRRLTLSRVALPRAACPEGSQAGRFVSEVSRATGYFMEDGDLFLVVPSDSVILRFRRRA